MSRRERRSFNAKQRKQLDTRGSIEIAVLEHEQSQLGPEQDIERMIMEGDLDTVKAAQERFPEDTIAL